MMSNVCIYRTFSHVVIALCRPKRGSWHVLHRRKSGVRFTTCATGSWCGSTPLNKTGLRPIDMPTCSARRTSGPRYLMWQNLFNPVITLLMLFSIETFLLLSFSPFLGSLCISESCHLEHDARGRSEQAQWKCGGIIQVCNIHYIYTNAPSCI